MIKLISRKAARFLCKDGDSKDNYDLYEYAVYILLSSTLHIATVIALGVCFNLLAESLVFYLSFIAIRKFAGGYHAKTSTICYIFSLLSSVIVLALIYVIETNLTPVIKYCAIFFMCICTTIVIFFSPVANDNKPLNKKEIKVYKRVSIIIVIILFFVSLLSMTLGNVTIGISISYGILMSAITLVMRKIQIIKSK